MYINSGKIKQIIEIFSGLNDKRQRELLSRAIYLEFEQNQEDMALKMKEVLSEEDLKMKTHNRIKESATLMKKLNGFDKEQLASVAILLNELSNGKLAKEEEIVVQINSRNMSINEYLEKNLPGTDISNARKILAEIKQINQLDKDENVK